MVESLPQISLGTAIIAIFLICAFYVIVRGMLRMMVGTLVIASSAWLGFRAWELAPIYSIQWTGGLSPFLIYGLPLGVFVAAFFLLRLILQTITRPFAERSDEHREDRFDLRRILFRLPLLLVPTALIFLIGAVVIHHLGSLEEIRVVASKTATEESAGELSYLGKLKASVTRAVPERWLSWLDPSTSPDRLNLAKLIAIQESDAAKEIPRLEPVIDPATGRPIPRAIIVEDLELQGLARDRSFGPLLRHPRLEQALADPEVQRWIEMIKR
ncbi:MAG: hypothetical protein ACNA8L_00700 [Luteolibacter sp.]